MSEDVEQRDTAGSVQLAYIYRDTVSHSWHQSLWDLFAHDRGAGRFLREKVLSIRTHAIRIPQSRNLVVKAFLEATDADWLFWVDTDMGFRPDALDRLLMIADPVKAPIVGGLCFGLYPEGYDGMNGMRMQVVPTMFLLGHRVSDGEPRFSPVTTYPEDTVCQVHGTGSAFVLIHRGVFEKVAAEHGEHWYDQMVDPDGETVGEDISFCMRAGALGTPMFVDTGTPTTHHKTLWLGEDDFWRALPGQTMGNPAPDLPLFTHLPSTFAALAANEHDHDGMLKLAADLERYERIIEATRPDIIVETGTHTGASASWFADRGPIVITVDVKEPPLEARRPGVHHVTGSSTDPVVVAQVWELVAGRRAMVVLDSEHSAAHVRREIEAYGPMVAPGCYLVVEDTVFGYGEHAKVQHGMGELIGSPLDAVVSHLHDNTAWSRDVAIEQTHPVSSNPAGWWVRNE